MWAAALLLLLGFNKGVSAFSSFDGHDGGHKNAVSRK